MTRWTVTDIHHCGEDWRVLDLARLVRTVMETAGWQLVLLRFLVRLSLTGGSSASHHRTAFKEKPMPELMHIDPKSAALLVMDYQVDALTRFMTAAQSADAGTLRGRPS